MFMIKSRVKNEKVREKSHKKDNIRIIKLIERNRKNLSTGTIKIKLEICNFKEQLYCKSEHVQNVDSMKTSITDSIDKVMFHRN